MKYKITQHDFANYSGPIGKVEFKDGESVEEIKDPMDVDLIHSTLGCESIDPNPQLGNAKNLVNLAESAYQNALTAIDNADVDKNGLITPTEQNAVKDKIQASEKAKSDAQAVVNILIDDADKESLQARLDAIVSLDAPDVTDKDENGIDDNVDALILDVEIAVSESESKYSSINQLLSEIQSDEVVTQEEVDELTQSISDAQQAKADAQDAVDALPDSVQDAKAGFQDRLDALTDVEVPDVTPEPVEEEPVEEEPEGDSE